MTRRAALIGAAAIAGAVLFPVSGLAERWPEWAEHAPQPPSSFQTKAPAVELLRETSIRFDGSDGFTETDRRVIRIRTREGRTHALPLVSYSTDGGKVKSLRAWVKTASGTVTEVDAKQAVDRANTSYEVYNEERYRLLNLPDEADAGSTVAWEAVVDSRRPVPHVSPALQQECPVLKSRVRLEPPANWEARATVWNHAPIEATREGAAYVWEFADLPELLDEPSGIPMEARAPQLGISLAARGASEPPPMLRWEDVSRWLAGLADPRAAITPRLESKARALTEGVTSPRQKTQAIARYVQGVNYIAIDLSLSRGEGYRPHAAADVLAQNYGDCKDKANLMRALLQAIGINSYLVTISAVDPTYVTPEWPSPSQFNHCIIGVRVGDKGDPCVADVPGLGPITVFDPTDPSTPWGSLPVAEQGASALLVSAQGGGLFRTPEAGPEENHEERVVQAQLSIGGALVGLLRSRASGATGAGERAGSRDLARAEYRKRVEDRIAGGAGGASVTQLETSDDSTGVFGLQAAFEAPRYGQPMAGFLSFRPVVAGPVRTGAAWPETRQTPLRLALQSLHETGRIRLPSGYTVDEVPRPVALETPFAAYRLECRLDAGALLFERTFQIRARTVAAKDYPDVRRFFEQIRAAEGTLLLLSRG